MTETLSKRTSSAVLAQEENLLDWNEVLKNFGVQPKKNNFCNTTYKYCKVIKKKLKLIKFKKIIYERSVTKSIIKCSFGKRREPT